MQTHWLNNFTCKETILMVKIPHIHTFHRGTSKFGVDAASQIFVVKLSNDIQMVNSVSFDGPGLKKG